ncbi:MAG: helix-turn-helix domain-containing protein [Candidatus Omnitrophica bacterium]|nr:helix-turn-helix domain-containing protein [Candidatus Omnitrophota bacterium]
MSRNNGYPHDPDYAVPPGQTLLESIQELGMDQRELALRTGLHAKTVNEIIKGKHPLSQQTAIKLERVTGVPARMWNNLEMLYQERLARMKDRERLELDLDWLKTIPTRELITRSIIEESKDKVSLLRQVLTFFGVGTVSEWEKYWMNTLACRFRRSQAFETKPGVTATWMRLGELKAKGMECEDYEKKSFLSALEQIRRLTREQPEVWQHEMISLCARAGVALVFIPEIRGCPASGVTRWLHSRKAMIQLSLRHKRDDHFWFTFFHEAGHVLEEHRKEIILEVRDSGDGEEETANRFATTFLIPKDRQKEMMSIRSRHEVERFASELNIAPGIVVGQLQKRGVIPFSHLNDLKVKLVWA